MQAMRLFIFLLFLSLTAKVLAFEQADPWATENALKLQTANSLAARVGSLPCADQLPVTALSAVDVLDLAICNHPQTREVWAAARLAGAQIGLAKSAWLPVLAGKLNESRVQAASRYETQKSAALTLSWLAFDFGAREAALENAQQLMMAATATQQATLQTLFLSALQAYYTAQATQAAVISSQQAEQAAQTSLAAAETRYRVGSGTPADRLQAQTAFSQATLNRIRAEGEARNALGSLANVMGFAPTKNILLQPTTLQVPGQAFQHEINSLMQQASAARPDLRAAEAQVSAAQASIEQARAQGRPTVSLTTGPSWQENAGVATHGGSLGVAVNVPIFSGFDTTYRIRAAQAQAESKLAVRDRLRQQIALDVWKAYQSLTTATQTVQTTQDLVNSAEQSERVALGRYKAGVGNVLDVLTAQTALASARLQRIQASLDWNVYRATLAQAMGALDYSLLAADTARAPAQESAAQGKP